jgi:hypothetical protein
MILAPKTILIKLKAVSLRVCRVIMTQIAELRGTLVRRFAVAIIYFKIMPLTLVTILAKHILTAQILLIKCKDLFAKLAQRVIQPAQAVWQVVRQIGVATQTPAQTACKTKFV